MFKGWIVFGLILGYLCLLFLIAYFAEKREQLGLPWNFPIDKLISQSADHSKERLVAIYEKILETDLAIKNGKWQDELALDLLVVDVCT